MNKQKVLDHIKNFGILNEELAAMMGLTVEELNEHLDQNEIPEPFLRKIEKAIGKENFFFMPNYGKENNFGDNNNSNLTINKLVDIIDKQNDLIRDLSLKLADFSNPHKN